MGNQSCFNRKIGVEDGKGEYSKRLIFMTTNQRDLNEAEHAPQRETLGSNKVSGMYSRGDLYN